MKQQPYSDLIVEAVENAEKFWNHNSHLIEDVIIGKIVQMNADARKSITFDGDPFPVDHQLRVILAGQPTALAQLQPFDYEPDFRVSRECDRCSDPAHQWMWRETEMRHLWITAGASIISILICPKCRQELERDYSPVVWKP